MYFNLVLLIWEDILVPTMAGELTIAAEQPIQKIEVETVYNTKYWC